MFGIENECINSQIERAIKKEQLDYNYCKGDNNEDILKNKIFRIENGDTKNSIRLVLFFDSNSNHPDFKKIKKSFNLMIEKTIKQLNSL